MPITQVKIFPPIGIARLGNSPDDFFIGPEVPGDRTPPNGGYKDGQCRIKRQAARFRLFGYDGNTLVGEITQADAQITWTVHLAHKKAAHTASDNSRTIDPGSRTLNGPAQLAKFDNGTFTLPGESPITVPLGEIRTDTDGRLLVLGGFGNSGSPILNPPSTLHDPNWFDDASDGPVTATVNLNVEGVVPVVPAWVIVGPPNFAPPVDNSITLYDRLFQQQGLAIPATPSFTQDIYPILRSAVDVSGVRDVGAAHSSWDFNVLSDPGAGAQAARQAIYNRVASPNDMPQLSGDGDLRQFQLDIMEKWKDGNFTNDWPGSPPVVDPNSPVTPDGLTKAALENCVGASFSPGIEVGNSIVSATINYIEDFRLDHAPIEPGFLTRVMSVPWQSDFMACGGNWWPAQRPVNVIPQGDTTYKTWTQGIGSYQEMVDNWHTLGFIVREGNNLVEVEKCSTSSVNLLTPSINFNNVPQGPGGLPRITSRAVIFEVISPGSSVNFSYVSGPSHVRLTRVAATLSPAGPTAPNTTEQYRIWIKYETGAVGENINDTIRIRNDDTSQEWEIEINASTAAAKKAAVALALDRSGSMDEDRGDGLGTKVNSLIEAAKIFVDVMPQGDGVGIARYNHNAQKLEDVVELGSPTDPFETGRSTVKGHFNTGELAPSGSTSIGDGLAEARNILNAASGYDVEALVVLSDGKENTPQYIADVAASINNQTYAIGFGTPENTNVAALQTLSGNNGGYLLITGPITGDNEFILKKYFLQILAGVTNAEIISDPQGHVTPRSTQRIPFKLCEAETGIDVILLTPLPQWIDFRLETPTGRIITPTVTETKSGMQYVLSEGVSYYRLSLPVELETQRYDKEGTWHALLRFVDPKGNDNLLSRYKHMVDTPWHNTAIPYSLIVHGYSDLRLGAFTFQKSFEPGAQALLSTQLSQYDIPLTDDVNVWAEITRPDGSMTNVTLQSKGDGNFTGHYDTSLNGIYQVRLRADGLTQMGNQFQRETTHTVPVWHGGDQPHVPSSPETEDSALTRCHYLTWLLILLLAIYIIVAGVAATSTGILKAFIGVAAIITGVSWILWCKPLLCKILTTILKGLLIGAAGLGVLWLAGFSNTLTTTMLALTAILAGFIGFVAWIRNCFR